MSDHDAVEQVITMAWRAHAVLWDYRNYVHPEKERSHGVILGNGDSDMLWTLTKSLVRQLLEGGTSGA